MGKRGKQSIIFNENIPSVFYLLKFYESTETKFVND